LDDATFLGTFLTYALVSAVICGAAGFFILERVERPGTGAALGALLGPIGLLIAWILRDNAIRDEEIRKDRHAKKQSSRLPNGIHGAVASSLHADLEALERLGKLREAGHLTEEEFLAKKRQILGTEQPRSVAARNQNPRPPFKFKP
jgi:hypothetical protein